MTEEYDNTNKGVLFPTKNAELRARGHIDLEGTQYKCILIREEISKNGRVENVLYVKLAVLWGVKSENDNAPSIAGNLEALPPYQKDSYRFAAWKRKSKAGKGFLSLSAEPPRSREDDPLAENPKKTAQSDPLDGMDDEIPF